MSKRTTPRNSLIEPLLGKSSAPGNNSPKKLNNRSHDWMHDIERLQQQELQHQLKLSAPKVGEIIDVTMKILNENVSIYIQKLVIQIVIKKLFIQLIKIMYVSIFV